MEWIEVKFELPEFHVDILFWSISDKTYYKGRFYAASHKFISDDNKFYKDDVSHWLYVERPRV